MPEGAPRVEGPPRAARAMPAATRVRRRGPLFRPSRDGRPGVFGLDLTAGCGFDCPFCFIRGTPRYPGGGRLYFDPDVVASVRRALEGPEEPPSRVVLSPGSDPLPMIPEVRAAAVRVIAALGERGVAVELLTRGRVTRDVVDVLDQQARVGLAITTLDRALGRALEPLAPSGWSRLRGASRLIEADVPLEVRLEPLILGLTDTRENLRPLFRALDRIGVRDVVAHYAFLQPAILPSFKGSLAPFERGERLLDDYDGGPVFSLGAAGATKHLPLDDRRAGLARVISWGAEFGLRVRTGTAQNPDLPRVAPTPPRDAIPPRAGRRSPETSTPRDADPSSRAGDVSQAEAARASGPRRPSVRPASASERESGTVRCAGAK